MAKVNPYDRAVEKYILDRYIQSSQYDERVHGSRSDLSVLSADTGWECGCYSEYTRDDQYVLEAVILTAKREVTFRYGMWGDLPEILEAMMNEEDLAEVCSIERHERERGW